MGWQDRNYGPRINYGETPHSNPIMNLLFGSFSVGTWFGIRVRIHAMLVWYLAFQLLRAGSIGWQDALASATVLFGVVLLHEFGHCIGARLVGGHAEQILLWPLGGLAFSSTERTPWARFVTVACGPLVNVLIGTVLAVVLVLGFKIIPPLNPLYAWSDSVAKSYFNSHVHGVLYLESFTGGRWLLWTWVMNLTILFFNLVPMYPLDGGKLAQIALWKPLGYYRSMNIACITGMVGAVALAIFGLYWGTFFTLFIAIFGFIDCYQQRRILQLTSAEDANDSPYDLSAAWEHPDRPATRKKVKKRYANAAKKRALAEQNEQAQIDAILDKVKQKGLHSLTWFEKRALRKATERQRQRDLAERM